MSEVGRILKLERQIARAYFSIVRQKETSTGLISTKKFRFPKANRVVILISPALYLSKLPSVVGLYEDGLALKDSKPYHNECKLQAVLIRLYIALLSSSSSS